MAKEFYGEEEKIEIKKSTKKKGNRK